MKKNTVSLLEAIKKKISKIDESDEKAAEQNLGDEFEYVEEGESSADKNADDKKANEANQDGGSDVEDINLESSIEESVSEASDSDIDDNEKVADDADDFDLSFDDDGANQESEPDLDFGDLDNMDNLDVDTVPSSESDGAEVVDKDVDQGVSSDSNSQEVEDQASAQENVETQDDFSGFDEVSQQENEEDPNSNFLRHVGDENQEQESADKFQGDDQSGDSQIQHEENHGADEASQSQESLPDQQVQDQEQDPVQSQGQEFEIDEFDQITAESNIEPQVPQSDPVQNEDSQEILSEAEFEDEGLAKNNERPDNSDKLVNVESFSHDSGNDIDSQNNENDDSEYGDDENFELDEDIAGEESFEVEEEGADYQSSDNVGTRFSAQALSSVKTSEVIADESEFEEGDEDENMNFDDLEDELNFAEQSSSEAEDSHGVVSESDDLHGYTTEQNPQVAPSKSEEETYQASTQDLNDQMEEFLNSDTGPQEYQDSHSLHAQASSQDPAQNATEEQKQKVSASSDVAKTEDYKFQTKYFSEEPSAEYKSFEYLEKDISINSKISEKVSETIKNITQTKQMINDVDGFVGGGMLSHVAFELMKPKLEVWLEANLPGLVENVVRQEIRKIISEENK